jgi:hypothetical protein
MTIHWKALEKHFLMVPLVFQFIHFQGENAFSGFFSKTLSFISFSPTISTSDFWMCRLLNLMTYFGKNLKKHCSDG